MLLRAEGMRRTSILVALISAAACGDGIQTFTSNTPIQEVCTPQEAAADQPLTLQARVCRSCETALVCTVRRFGPDEILLDVTGEVQIEADATCPSICIFEVATCELPPLTPGTYALTANNGTLFQEPALLQVVAAGGATSCQLPPQ